MRGRPRELRSARLALAAGSAAALAGAAAALPAGAVGTAVPTAPAGAALTALAAPPPRSALARERIYAIVTDRFANGTPANDAGFGAGEFEETGYEPTHTGAYHGGDLQGLTARLDYVAALGMTAIAITPPVVNRSVQGSSTGYHGAWGLDFTDVDPHLGTRAELAALVDRAHELGLKVFLDVVLNHTADVIGYAGSAASAPYVPLARRPYRDASGVAFDPAGYAGKPGFPRLLPDRRSFPYAPLLARSDRNVKRPRWLNDVRNYHNRGDTTFAGESLTYGDLLGLDDLFTEKAAVVRGLAEIYAGWIRAFRLDGLRVEAARHVNPELWAGFVPAVRRAAAAVGVADLGVVADVVEPGAGLALVRRHGLPSVLDGGFQASALAYATGAAGAAQLDALFARDDLYTTPGTTAHELVTLLGNAELGRVGYLVARGRSAAAALASDRLAHELLLLLRGVPAVLYGDEVGMTGSGDGRGDNARQDMFPTRVAAWRAERRVGSLPVRRRESFDPSHPLTRHLTRLNRLVAAHPALRDGAQIVRYAGRGASASVFAVSRIDAAARTEYVVAFNNAARPKTVTLRTSTPQARFAPLWPGGGARPASDEAGVLRVTVPARRALVLRSTRPLPRAGAPRVVLLQPAPDRASGLLKLTAVPTGIDPATVTFAVRGPGERGWRRAGTDDAPPYRVYLDEEALSRGRELHVVAVARSSSGAVAASEVASYPSR